MSRRRRAVKREILPDAKFGDIVITRFMNALMYDGKKSVAEGTVYGALDSLKRRGDGDAARLLFRRLVDLVVRREGRPAGLCQHLGDGRG